MAQISVTATVGDAKGIPLLTARYTRITGDASPTAAKVKAWLQTQFQQMVKVYIWDEFQFQQAEAQKTTYDAEVT